MRGGKRPGAGRPPGAATSRAVDWLDADNLTPLETLEAIMRDPRTPTRLRLWCAIQAAPYRHRKLEPKTD
jgi:hypothetical protein